jgi:uncharacterized RDD family membrane protein YckC
MSVYAAAEPAQRRELVTPEGVDLRIELPSASQRAGAFLLDAVIIMAVMVLATLALALVGWATKGPTAKAVLVLWLLGFFLLRAFWFTGFELGPRAATPGKRVFGLRVAARHGGRLTADAVFARNAMREIEVFLPLSFLAVNAGAVGGALAATGLIWSGVFTFFPLFNRDRLRVGDLVAGTFVVLQPRRRLRADLAGTVRRDAGFTFTAEQLSAYGVSELQVLEGVLRDGERAAMRLVAERIRLKIGWVRGAEEGDRAFLEAYYAGLRAKLESGLLLGQRRRDKHDVAPPRLHFTAEQLAVYGPRQAAVLAEVLKGGDPAALNATAARIRARIGWTDAGAPVADRAFLTAYATALDARLAREARGA